MEKLFLILLIALTTCSSIEESFDDNIVLEISKGKAIVSPKVRHTTRDVIAVSTRLASKVKNVRDSPLKRINDILKGKSGKEFRKEDIIKDRYFRLKQKNLRNSKHVPLKLKILGQQYFRNRNSKKFF